MSLLHTEFKNIFKMKSFMFSAQLTILWYCCTDWLSGLILNIPVIARISSPAYFVILSSYKIWQTYKLWYCLFHDIIKEHSFICYFICIADETLLNSKRVNQYLSYFCEVCVITDSTLQENDVCMSSLISYLVYIGFWRFHLLAVKGKFANHAVTSLSASPLRLEG
jgi:hypothetical protein